MLSDIKSNGYATIFVVFSHCFYNFVPTSISQKNIEISRSSFH